MSADMPETWELHRLGDGGEWENIGAFQSIPELARHIMAMEKINSPTLVLKSIVQVDKKPGQGAVHLEFKGRYASYFACAAASEPV